MLGWGVSLAHDLNTASVVIKEINGLWTVHFSFSRQGADYAMSEFLDRDISTIDKETYKSKISEYVRDHFRLTADGVLISLGSGGIKLGSHQTDVRFVIPRFPDNYEELDFSIPLFNENVNHHTILRFSDGAYSFRKVLSKVNDYTCLLKPLDSSGRSEKNKGLKWILGLSILAILGVGIKRFWFKAT